MQITAQELTDSYDEPVEHRIAGRDAGAQVSLLASRWFWLGGLGSLAIWTALAWGICKLF